MLEHFGENADGKEELWVHRFRMKTKLLFKFMKCGKLGENILQNIS
jgi:hypothetical protein